MRSPSPKQPFQLGHTDALQCEGRAGGRVVTWKRCRTLASRAARRDVRCGVHERMRGFADDLFAVSAPLERDDGRWLFTLSKAFAGRAGSWMETHRLDVVRAGLRARARWGSVGGGRLESHRQVSPRRRGC